MSLLYCIFLFICHIFLAFNLDFYTDVLDLNFLLDHIKDDPFTQKYKKLNEALVGLVEDYGLVSFKTLDIQVIIERDKCTRSYGAIIFLYCWYCLSKPPLYHKKMCGG